MSPEARSLLAEGLRELGLLAVGTEEHAVGRLATYLDALLEWNERMNLVGPTDEVGAVTRHLLDSAAALPLLESIAPSGARIADVGSGAGLPGIPVAILRPSYRMTLVERSTKKCGFLRFAAERLELANVSVVDRDLREVPDRWDILLLRAVSEINVTLLDMLRRHLKRGGAAVLYKGRRETVDRELSAASLGGREARTGAAGETRTGTAGEARTGAAGEARTGAAGTSPAQVTVRPIQVPHLDAERHIVVLRFPRVSSASRRG